MKKALILTILIASLGLGVVWPAIQDKRRDEQVKTLLLELQRAVQDYHVDEEVYPRATPQSGSELIALLMESGHLKAIPHNPWTNDVWAMPNEVSDFLVYKTDDLAETYTLVAYRSSAKESIHHTLDSTTNQSLEATD